MRLAMGRNEVFDAESLLEEYVGPRRRGSRHAYPAYDGLVTNGDPRRLVTGDLLAPSLLRAPVDLDRMATLTALMPLLQRGLDELPTGVCLADADERVCERLAALYDPLDDPDVAERDVKGSLIAKVLHRKRPELIPLYDSRVLMFYRGHGSVPARRGERSWREQMGLLVTAIRADLRDNRAEFDRLADDAVPVDGPRLTPLRILDIVVWMSSAV